MFAKLLAGNARLASLMRKAELSSELSFNLRGDHLKDCHCFSFISQEIIYLRESLHNGETLQSVVHVPGIHPAWTFKSSRKISVEIQRRNHTGNGHILLLHPQITAPNPAHNLKRCRVNVADRRWKFNGSDPKCERCHRQQGNWSGGFAEVVKPKRGAGITERCH